VLAYFAGPGADLEWRRGWTHGVLALTVLPFLLTASLLALYRFSRRIRGRASVSVNRHQLLLLSSVAILSHPFLDTLNTYGVRWLMPFSGRWFYGDTLFIIDPWVWLALVVGVYRSWRRERLFLEGATRPARVALAVILLYMAAMAASGWMARGIIGREVASLSAQPVESVMAGPAPLDPTVKRFVVEQDGDYRVGTFRWLDRPHVRAADVLTYPRGRPSHPAFQVALKSESARRFMVWARFPTFEVQAAGADRYLVHFVDLRYARGPDDSFGALSVPVTLK
jgi:inner membrane protein